MLYLQTPLRGNEFKVFDGITHEVVAIFYNQENAIDYINSKKPKTTFSDLKADFIAKHNGIDVGDAVGFKRGKSFRSGVISKIDLGGIPCYYYKPFKYGSLSKEEDVIWGQELETLQLIQIDEV